MSHNLKTIDINETVNSYIFFNSPWVYIMDYKLLSFFISEHFEVDYKSFSDYYPYGMLMDGRYYSSSGYRFGFGGQEKDQDINSNGNVYTAEFWEYDSRISRRWNVDPAEGKHPDLSAYSVFINNPLLFNDPEGDDPDPKKARRSMKKYGRKFDRELRRQNRQGTFSTLENVHNTVGDRYRGKSWMWIKDIKDGDQGSEETINNRSWSSHAQYWHAGDLYRQSRPNVNTSITTTTPTIVNTVLTFNSQGSVMNPDMWTSTLWKEFTISNSGVLNITTNVTASGWNLDIIQSDGSTSPIMIYSDLYGSNPGVNQLATWRSTPTSLTFTYSFNFNTSQGNLLYLAYNWIGTTAASSSGGSSSNPTMSVSFSTTRNITTTRPRIYIAKPIHINKQLGNYNVDRLSRATKRRLFGYRVDLINNRSTN